ncbi:VCBS repeat-containing protein [Cnuella takakiae]|nr:VCBS repeat-containing protein [Cnuella takakiae]OLY91903.1 hypothetical protein BUE76_08335 [Cnuella takakiae]
MPHHTLEKHFLLLLCLPALLLALGCGRTEEGPALFTPLSAKQTGIQFINRVEEVDSTKSFVNEFGYMGGGVGIGDFNKDGLPDIFFTGNQVSCRMYLNKGGNQFTDITTAAGLQTPVWATGVSVVDINSDGYDDLYVCTYGKDLNNRTKNLLFINQRNLTFREEAAQYGLADTGYSSQAAFLDYDKDGDLDMYLANYMLNGPNANTLFRKDSSGRAPASDRLYRNTGYNKTLGHPVYEDVTVAAHMGEDGFGLGVVVSDVNNDNWPDIYVANDFVSNDILWLNNKKGGFTNCSEKSLQHTSYSSMGVDAADINNDGLSDLATLDMLPEFNERKKTSFSMMNYNRYESERQMGYQPEFVRNMLQLNRGTYQEGETDMPFFSEIGQMAGIAATDWSWSVLLADFDNDGWKDMHITNGIGRDFINGDFLEFSEQQLSDPFEPAERKKQKIREKLASLKHIALSNYLFQNKDGHHFTDISEQAHIGDTSMSNGAAYADLDNDGDLDLVVNNINSEAFILQNNTAQGAKNSSHYLQFNLVGEGTNLQAMGAKVWVYAGGQVQVQEQNPVKGYYSSVDRRLHFGLGKQDRVDSVVVLWPNDKVLVLAQPRTDTIYTLSVADAGRFFNPEKPVGNTLMEPLPSMAYLHRENPYNDFDQQRLLPQKFSGLGPFMATGDINGDSLADLFVGGAFNSPGKLLVQQPDGNFIPKDLTTGIKMNDDGPAAFFDADKDGDLDLLLTYGETSYADGVPQLKPSLFLNDGKGNFTLQQSAIPDGVSTIGGCVAPADYDGDGDLDFFIGGRVSARSYPQAPRSFLLQNNGGRFTDVTSRVAPALERAGMVTAASWSDYSGDGKPDLVVTGEWMPVRFFTNSGGALHEATGATGLKDMEGMWRSLALADTDGDGDQDIVAGNLGANCIYKASPAQPMQLMAADMDKNGSIDPVMFYHIREQDGRSTLRPAISRSQFAEQVPAIKKQYLRYADYAKADANDIFKKVEKDKLLQWRCTETRSCILENKGGGRFEKKLLPAEAQFAPINAILCTDLDGDGFTDLVLAGNEYQTDVITGRYDASYGCVLRGGKGGLFRAVSPAASGMLLKGDVKSLALLQQPWGRILVGGVNNDSLRVFRIRK